MLRFVRRKEACSSRVSLRGRRAGGLEASRSSLLGDSLQSCLTLRPLRGQWQELLQAGPAGEAAAIPPRAFGWAGVDGSLRPPGWHLQDASKPRLGTETNARVECAPPPATCIRGAGALGYTRQGANGVNGSILPGAFHTVKAGFPSPSKGAEPQGSTLH